MARLEGPFIGLQPGPLGDGGAQLDALMTHLTGPKFVCVAYAGEARSWLPAPADPQPVMAQEDRHA